VKHAACPDTAIIHELDIPRPSGRIDVALINGRLAGFEIKSSADTLARLADQEASFSAVFERMTLVVSHRHSDKSRSMVPDWWEILEADNGVFRLLRRGQSNPNLNLESLLYVLTKAELWSVQRGLGLVVNSKSHKEIVVAAILGSRQRSKVLDLVRDALKRRATSPLNALAASPVHIDAQCGH
jgi:hypothetical protein